MLRKKLEMEISDLIVPYTDFKARGYPSIVYDGKLDYASWKLDPMIYIKKGQIMYVDGIWVEVTQDFEGKVEFPSRDFLVWLPNGKLAFMKKGYVPPI